MVLADSKLDSQELCGNLCDLGLLNNEDELKLNQTYVTNQCEYLGKVT